MYTLIAEPAVGYSILVDSEGYLIKDVEGQYVSVIGDYGYHLYGNSVSFTITAAPVNHYTLLADVGNFALQGEDVEFSIESQAYTLIADPPIGHRLLIDSLGNPVKDEEDQYIYTVSDYGYNLYGWSADFTIDITYLLEAEVQSYILTGSDASFELIHTISAETQSYELTGNDASLHITYSLLANPRAYVLTGNSAGLRAVHKLTAETQSYVFEGIAAEFKNFKLIAEAASFNLSGGEALFIQLGEISANTGNYLLTGSNAELFEAKRLVAETQSYMLTGNAIGSSFSYTLIAETQSYALTGNAIGAISTYTLSAGTGAYALTGSNMGAVGSYVLIAESARGRRIWLDPDGNPVRNPAGDYLYVLSPYGYNIYGGKISFAIGQTLLLDMGEFVLSGEDVNFLLGNALTASPGSFILEGNDVSFRKRRVAGYYNRDRIRTSIDEKIAYIEFATTECVE